MGLEDIDLTDLALFAGGFPDDVFTRLRREAPVWWHEPTTHTPDGVGFWVVSRHADMQAVGVRRRDVLLGGGTGRRPAGARSSRTCRSGSPPACSST